MVKKYLLKAKILSAFIPCAVFSLHQKKEIGSFEYISSYLDREDSYPLDPINLPLKKGLFTTTYNNGYFGFLHDMLPHGWNRKMLMRQNKEVSLKTCFATTNMLQINDYNFEKSYLDLSQSLDRLEQYQEQIF